MVAARVVRCRRCGSDVDVDPAALRLHIVHCPSCGTVQGIGEDEAEVPGATPGQASVAGLTIERDDTTTVITATRAPGQLSLDRRTAEIATAVGMVSMVPFIVLLGIQPGFQLGCLVAAVGVLLVGYTRTRLPPLRLDDEGVHTSASRRTLRDLAQVYVSRTRLTAGPWTVVDAAHVWGVRANGHRAHLAGPVSDADGLAIEALVEIHQGLIQQPVHGDVAHPDLPPAPTLPQPVPSTREATSPDRCPACGAPLSASDDHRRRGWMPCPHCGNLLLIDPDIGSPDALAGLGEAGATRRHVVAGTGGHLEIRRHPAARDLFEAPKRLGIVAGIGCVSIPFWLIVVLLVAMVIGDGPMSALIAVGVGLGLVVLFLFVGGIILFDEPVIALSPGRIRWTLRPLPVPFLVHDWDARARVEVLPPRDDLERAPTTDDVWQAVRQRMAWSGEEPLSDTLGRVRWPRGLRIALRTPDGRQAILFDDLESAQEAFELAEHLRRTLGQA